ncbi:YqaJ viral recombinase family protein [Corynebacterium sp. A21]|uniref:YqaJ viral recombinase family protein n=1 Tax=Corynebacterium sp. A21 TaxID=3457318 RepID=UPI003FD020D2
MQDMSVSPVLVPGTPEHLRTMTASKIPVIFGLSDWESPAQLWLRMRGDIPPQDVNDAMLRGHNQEQSILEWFFERMRPEFEWVSGETTITRPDLPWAAANPDSVAKIDGKHILVEAKSVARPKQKVKDGEIVSDPNDPRLWGKPGTDNIPWVYTAQVQWQLHMTQYFGGLMAREARLVKHGPWVDQWDEYVIHYNPEFAKMLERKAHQFWLSLADGDACPEPSATLGEAAAFAKLHPEIERELEWQVSLDRAIAFHDARNRENQAKLDVEQAKAMILRDMGNARVAKVGELLVARRQPTKKGVSLYPPQGDLTAADIHQAAQKDQETAA